MCVSWGISILYLTASFAFDRSQEREILNPVISHPSGHRKLSAVLFAEESPVVITGADDGQIDVYR
eukprot:SAG11_NODE_1336_length_5173_cov_10.716791_4_plen_66_part_00